MIIHAAGGIMLFQLTAARRRLGFQRLRLFRLPKFQLTAARRRLGLRMCRLQPQKLFQLTAARRRLGLCVTTFCLDRGFNSQPPEGGWTVGGNKCGLSVVSTHSRPKAAGRATTEITRRRKFQLTAARRRLGSGLARLVSSLRVSTHSRPKAAGRNHF